MKFDEADDNTEHSSVESSTFEVDDKSREIIKRMRDNLVSKGCTEDEASRHITMHIELTSKLTKQFIENMRNSFNILLKDMPKDMAYELGYHVMLNVAMNLLIKLRGFGAEERMLQKMFDDAMKVKLDGEESRLKWFQDEEDRPDDKPKRS